MVKIKFIGVLNGKKHDIHVDDHGESNHIYTISVDGKIYTLDSRAMSSEIVTALIDNKSYDIDLDKAAKFGNPLDGRMAVRVRGRVIRLEMLDERRYKMKEAQETHFSEGGSARINSPMPGKVLRMLVAVSDEVKAGDGVCVIEAMKMENELRAPKDGVVSAILAQQGDTVEAGAHLLTIE